MSTTHKKTILVARLSKDGDWVLCGRPNCGGRLAQVICGKGGGIHDLKANGRQPRQIDHMTPFGGKKAHSSCSIVFPAGWQEVDGVWQVTKSAKRRYDDDRRLARGGMGVSNRERVRAQERLSSGRTMRFTHPSAENQGSVPSGATQKVHRALLPTIAVCPDCFGGRGFNRLEQELLDEAIDRAATATALGTSVN